MYLSETIPRGLLHLFLWETVTYDINQTTMHLCKEITSSLGQNKQDLRMLAFKRWRQKAGPPFRPQPTPIIYVPDNSQRVEITSAITQGFLQQILKSPKEMLGP